VGRVPSAVGPRRRLGRAPSAGPRAVGRRSARSVTPTPPPHHLSILKGPLKRPAPGGFPLGFPGSIATSYPQGGRSPVAIAQGLLQGTCFCHNAPPEGEHPPFWAGCRSPSPLFFVW
jgi:hypothetical protein